MITEQMINELNEIFSALHAICRIKQLEEDNTVYKIIPVSCRCIENNSLYLNDEGERLVEDYFNKRNIKIRWNNNHTIFWGDIDVK